MLFLGNSGTLGNMSHNQGATRQQYDAYGHKLWLDGPILNVMLRFNTEKASVIDGSGCKPSARLGARHTNTCFQDGDRMAETMDLVPVEARNNDS